MSLVILHWPSIANRYVKSNVVATCCFVLIVHLVRISSYNKYRILELTKILSMYVWKFSIKVATYNEPGKGMHCQWVFWCSALTVIIRPEARALFLEKIFVVCIAFENWNFGSIWTSHINFCMEMIFFKNIYNSEKMSSFFWNTFVSAFVISSPNWVARQSITAIADVVLSQVS